MDNKNYHVQYLDVTSQYWSPKEGYAGGDHLLTALNNSWDVAECHLQLVWYTGSRSVRVYHFTLVRGGEIMKMPVVDNPYVDRFISLNGIEVQTTEDKPASLASAS
jgi:hypothetical protein